MNEETKVEESQNEQAPLHHLVSREFLESIGFQEINGDVRYRSRHWGHPIHHQRHQQLMTRDGKWWLNGLGIATPKTEQDVRELIRIAFGESG